MCVFLQTVTDGMSQFQRQGADELDTTEQIEWTGMPVKVLHWVYSLQSLLHWDLSVFGDKRFYKLYTRHTAHLNTKCCVKRPRDTETSSDISAQEKSGRARRFQQRNVIWRHLFGIGFLTLQCMCVCVFVCVCACVCVVEALSLFLQCGLWVLNHGDSS